MVGGRTRRAGTPDVLIAEVGVEVVQISTRLRPHVRQKDIATFLQTEARNRLKLAITRTPVVPQQQRIRSWFDHEIPARASFFITEAEQQPLRDLMIHL